MASTADDLFLLLRKLREGWPKRGWSWDTRFSCVASAFSTELSDEAHQVTKIAFPHEWNHKTLNTSPPIVQQLAERTGGVRSDQLVLCSAPAGGIIAYGLWWPWGDDTTISLRIGIAGGNAVRLEDQLRETFGANL